MRNKKEILIVDTEPALAEEVAESLNMLNTEFNFVASTSFDNASAHLEIAENFDPVSSTPVAVIINPHLKITQKQIVFFEKNYNIRLTSANSAFSLKTHMDGFYNDEPKNENPPLWIYFTRYAQDDLDPKIMNGITGVITQPIIKPEDLLTEIEYFINNPQI